ncbi:MAG: hypothetical protein ABIF09_09835 [Gemmatimonadota bacterium]
MTSALVPLARLPQEFRGNARAARRLAGSEAAAHVWEAAAVEVEQRLQESFLEPLTLEVAVSESGYTRNHLNRMLREKKLPNSGTDADPRILRMHLPRKPWPGVDAGTIHPASSRVQAARAVIEGEE